jgi:hypothetical protein
MAWEAAVYGWHRDLREWTSCERALRRLDAWISENSVNSLGVYAQIMAWGSLLELHRKRRDFETMARLEPEALARVETALKAYPDDPELAEGANYIYAEVALSRRNRNTGRHAIEEMAELTRAMVGRFPLSKNVRTNNDLVEDLLRGPAANTLPSAPAQRDGAPYGGTSGSP